MAICLLLKISLKIDLKTSDHLLEKAHPFKDQSLENTQTKKLNEKLTKTSSSL